MTEESTEESVFNLADEPWIECAMVGGGVGTFSLREVFQKAAEIKRIAGDSPTQDYAVLRVLLAIYWRASRTDELLEEDAEEWWVAQFQAAREGSEEFDDAVREYLSEWHDRLALIGPGPLFMQVPNLERGSGDYLPVRRIIPESEADYFSMRAGHGLDSLTFAEAARWLIAIQAWDYSGIKPGAVGDERVKGGKGYPIGTGWTGRTGGIVLHGSSLAETLVLNTSPAAVFGEGAEEDLPAWEREPDTASARGTEIPLGPCDVVTWQARRVRLYHREGRVVGVLVTNGDRIELKNQWADPMTAYRYSKNQSSKAHDVYMPRGHFAERTLWRGLQPLLVRESGVVEAKKGELPDQQPKTIAWLHRMREEWKEELPDSAEIGVELVGVEYGSNDSVVLHIIHEELPLKLRTLLEGSPRIAHQVVTAANGSVAAAINVGQFAGTLAQAAGGTYAFDKTPTEAVLNDLSTSFKNWLRGLDPSKDPGAYRDQWFDHVEERILREAAVLARGAGERALRGTIQEDRLVTSATAMVRLKAALKKSLERTEEHRNASTADHQGGTA